MARLRTPFCDGVSSSVSQGSPSAPSGSEATVERRQPEPGVRRSQPDLIVSRDGATLEVSLSRRGLHRLGAIAAVFVSAWVAWVGMHAPSSSPDSLPVSAQVTAVSVPIESARGGEVALVTSIPVGVSAIPSASAAPTVVPRTEPTRVPPAPVAPAPLPVGAGYVVSVDGPTTDLRLTWNDAPPSSTGDWAFEAWLRPRGSGGGTIYSEVGPTVGAQPRRYVWIDGTDVWAASKGGGDDNQAFVAKGVASWQPQTWHHLAVTWSRDVPLVVADGTSVLAVVGTPAQINGAGSAEKVSGLLLPAEVAGGFLGDVDDVRFWSAPRSANSLALDRNRRMEPDAPGLARYFPISAGTGVGAAIDDATQQGAPLQLVTGARWSRLGVPEAPGLPPTPTSAEADENTKRDEAATVGADAGYVVATDFASPDLRNWAFDGGARPVGAGWLRLADAAPMRLGVAHYERDLPLGAGLTIRFVYRVSGDSGPAADGIVAFLWDPTFAPFTAGYGGGSLGYGRYCRTGLSGAIVGIGIDVFGTFGSSEPTCNNGPAQRAPDSISVRGPGNGMEGYALIATSALRRKLVGVDRSGESVEVTARVYPDGSVSVLTRYESEAVPVESIVRTAFQNPGATLPGSVRLGFAGATGGLSAAHDLRDVVITLGVI